MPSARATRTLSAQRVPTGSAPARSHVAPPPGKAYLAVARPAGHRDARATWIPAAIARSAADINEGSVVRAAKRVEGRRMRLLDVVCCLDRARQRYDDPCIAHRG